MNLVIKLLRADPAGSSPSAVSNFKRHVEEKRKKKYFGRNRILHKDTSALLSSVQEKWKEIWKMLVRCWIGYLN